MSKETQQAKQELAQAVKDAGTLIAKQAADAMKVIADAASGAAKVIADNKVAEQKVGGFSNLLYKQISLGMSIISLVGIVLGVFIYLTGPTKDNDTALQLQEQRVATQDQTIKDLTKTQQNDTVEVKSAIKDLVDHVGDLNVEIGQLTAIINERIPSKK